MKVIQPRAGQVIPDRPSRFCGSGSLTLFIALLCVAFFITPSFYSLLTWQRAAPLGVQIWTSHLIHWSWNHLIWDLLVFTVIGCILERTDRRLLLSLLFVAPPVIIGSTWFFESHATYRGLSGLDCALYSGLLVAARERNWLSSRGAIGLLILILGKSLLEIIWESPLFVTNLPENITSVPWAHVSGTSIGVIVALMRVKTIRRANQFRVPDPAL